MDIKRGNHLWTNWRATADFSLFYQGTQLRGASEYDLFCKQVCRNEYPCHHEDGNQVTPFVTDPATIIRVKLQHYSTIIEIFDTCFLFLSNQEQQLSGTIKPQHNNLGVIYNCYLTH